MRNQECDYITQFKLKEKKKKKKKKKKKEEAY
jgi:hypothetical protein